MASVTLPPAEDHILHKLWEDGEPTYLVGGCVRDLLLKKDPDDWDLVTTALPEKVSSRFRCVDLDSQRYGVTFVVLDGKKIDVATLRRDGGYRDARHPEEVTFTRSIEEDAARRDFTVNALYIDLTGKVEDPTGKGLQDLQDGLLRCVGNQEDRFSEDPLRIMRLWRLAAQLGFQVEEVTAAHARAMVSLIHKVSKERVTVELWKMLRYPTGPEMLCESGILEELFCVHEHRTPIPPEVVPLAKLAILIHGRPGIPGDVLTLSRSQAEFFQQLPDLMKAALRFHIMPLWEKLEWLRKPLFRLAIQAHDQLYVEIEEDMIEPGIPFYQASMDALPALTGKDVMHLEPERRSKALRVAMRLQDEGFPVDQIRKIINVIT